MCASQVEKFYASMDALDSHLTALCAMARQPSPPANDTLVAARWATVRTLAELAGFLEKFLLAPLEAGGDAHGVAQTRAAMHKLIKHADRWPADAVRNDWPGFCRALPEANRIIHDHYAWVARIAPPLLETLEGASAAPKRNWTRPIWAVQEAFWGSEPAGG